MDWRRLVGALPGRRKSEAYIVFLENKRALKSISDDELLHSLSELMRDSRRVESEVVAHIAEVDGRRLYAREASPSMFAYCTEVLHLSGAEAYLRIAAARASREHPMLLTMLGDGRLHLSGIARLATHLTRENAEGLLKRAVHKSKRQIEELIAELVPRPDVPAVMRKLPARQGRSKSTPDRLPIPGSSGTGDVATGDTPDERGLSLGSQPVASAIELRPDGVGTSEPETRMDGAVTKPRKLGPDGLRADGMRAPSNAPVPAVIQSPAAPVVVQPPAPRALVQPLSPARYKVRFTASAALHDKLERLRALMRTRVPDGDLAAVIEEAVTEKLERLETRRFAITRTPRKRLSTTDTTPSSRQIPAAVRRAVYERDESRCRFVDGQGRRCTEHHRLEFHHIHPFALGGDHDPRKIRLMCRAHNQYLAEQDYGNQAMGRYRRSVNQVSEGSAQVARWRAPGVQSTRSPKVAPRSRDGAPPAFNQPGLRR